MTTPTTTSCRFVLAVLGDVAYCDRPTLNESDYCEVHQPGLPTKASVTTDTLAHYPQIYYPRGRK